MLSGESGTSGRGAQSRAPDLAFARDVIEGLGCRPKRLPSKYFYDHRGTGLFDALCATPEYYLDRCETSLLKAHCRQLAEYIGDGANIVEIGGVDASKARVVLGALKNPQIYAPIHVSAPHLWSSAMQLQLAFPLLGVRPILAEFMTLRALPDDCTSGHDQLTFFFFGSAYGTTFANFDPLAGVKLLRRCATLAPHSLLIIGVDLCKRHLVLERTYNDATGFAGEFNLNLLARINRELHGDFNLEAFEHVAFFNEQCGRMEMHLRSVRRQNVHIGDERFAFDKGEMVHTESSYKYTVGQFERLARRANYVPMKVWIDPDWRFSLQVWRTAGDGFL